MRYYDVRLISQSKSMTCWHAAMCMICSAAGRGDPIASIPWLKQKVANNQAPTCLRSTDLSSFSSIVGTLVSKVPGGTGATPHNADCSEITRALKDAGFMPIPGQPLIYNAEWLEEQLPQYGPMFVGGHWLSTEQSFHALVITGVAADMSPHNTLFINDPSPVGKGSKRTESIEWLNRQKERALPIHYLPFSWLRLCK